MADSRVDMQSKDDVVTLRFAPAIEPVIVRQAGFSLDAGGTYVAELQLRADAGAGQPILWEVKEDHAPWRVLANRTIAPTPEWTAYQLSFEAPFALEGSGRYSVTGTGGAVQLRGWSVRMPPTGGLAPGDQLEAGTVRLPSLDETPTGPRADDLLRFLVDRDRAYARRLRATARDTARPDLPVTGTQMYYGGLLNLDAQADMDYRDNHMYVDHYTFDRVAWDPYDWSIANVSSVGSGLASFVETAAAREAGYPYVVSEFNEPWPNQFGMEIDPTLAAFASFQDWDGLVHFAYEQGGARGLDAGIPAGFNLDADWAKVVNIGQSAWLFRTGAVRTGTASIDVPVSQDTRLRTGRDSRNRGISEQLGLLLGLDPAVALAHPVRLAPQDSAAVSSAARVGDAALVEADTGELAYHRMQGVLTIAAPLAAGVFGFAGGVPVDAGPLTVERVADETGFAAVLLTSLDGQPLNTSRRVLLTNPGPVLRSQPGTAPPRPQRLAPYAGGSRWTLEPTDPGRPSGSRIDGVAPTWMERVDTLLTLHSTIENLQVFPLDHAGARLAPLGADDVQHIDGGYRLHLHAPGGPWYELATNSN
jgi:hypothetical protein